MKFEESDRSPPQFGLKWALGVTLICSILLAAVRAWGVDAFFPTLLTILIVGLTLKVRQLVRLGQWRREDDM